MNEFEITLTREEFLGSFGLPEEKLKKSGAIRKY